MNLLFFETTCLTTINNFIKNSVPKHGELMKFPVITGHIEGGDQ